MSAQPYQPLVAVSRGGLDESIHYGLVVICDPDGSIDLAIGDPDTAVILRSVGKPFQAAEFVASGAADALRVDDESIAVAVGSHGGTPAHVAAVERLLSAAQVGVRDLQCGTHPPFDREARLIANRSGASVLQNNCSGKHAAMLAGCRHRGLPIANYLEPSHPWQQALLFRLAETAGVPLTTVTTVTDGCSAPSFVIPARAAARACARLAAGESPWLARIFDCSVKHPAMIAGEGRLETDLMRAAPTPLLAKNGAEGVFALAWRGARGPRGALIKIADGNDARARHAVALEVAARGIGLGPELRAQLVERHLPPVTTLRGETVGAIRTLFPA